MSSALPSLAKMVRMPLVVWKSAVNARSMKMTFLKSRRAVRDVSSSVLS